MTLTAGISRRKRGFTLIELLIVIIVIAILSAMSLVVVRTAIHSGKASSVKMQMQQLSMALDNYKTKVGEYPPDNFLDTQALERHLKKRWPRARYDDGIVSAFLRQVVGIDPTAGNSAVALEARSSYVSPLIYFLGGPVGSDGKPMGFCISPTDPFNPDPTVQREEPLFKFPDNVITDQWVGEIPAIIVQNTPILYFRSESKTKYRRGDGHIKFWPLDVEFSGSEGSEVADYIVWEDVALELGTMTPFANGSDDDDFLWCETDSFQLIHPGMDKMFAPESNIDEPRLIGDLTPADEDTITSFNEGLTAGSEK